MSKITQILLRLEHGDRVAAEELLPLVYQELRQLAAKKMAQEPPGQTLQATVLVHEAYLRLTETGEPPSWSGRAHFFAAAAEAMRRILVDQARRKRAAKRGGRAHRVALEESQIAAPEPEEDLLAVHEALDLLAAEDAIAAELVRLRFFAGFHMQEIADILGMSLRSAQDVWAYARSWLHQKLRPT